MVIVNFGPALVPLWSRSRGWKHISKCPYWYSYLWACSNDHPVELLLTHFKHYPVLQNLLFSSPLMYLLYLISLIPNMASTEAPSGNRKTLSQNYWNKEDEFSESDGFKIPLNYPRNMNISFSYPLKHISNTFWYRYLCAFSTDHSVELLLTHFKDYPVLHIRCFVSSLYLILYLFASSPFYTGTSPQHKHKTTVQLYINLW